MKLFKTFILFFLCLFSLNGCAQNKHSNSLTVNELKERIRNNDSTMVILDVRTEAELTGLLPQIKGAVHIPVQELDNRVDELKKYKNKEIIVVCRTQNRSSVGAELLREKGYNAKNVMGGMREYYK
jgi:rhodanese-related sulfurtransferase